METMTIGLCRNTPAEAGAIHTIEKAFCKLKALLRARARRTVDALWDTVGEIVTLFKP